MRPRRCRQPNFSMDFGALPPEFNSARMYSGPGPGSCWPLRRPGTGWPPNCIPRHLYGSVISELTDVVVGSVVGGDGGRRRALCGVDERDRRAS